MNRCGDTGGTLPPEGLVSRQRRPDTQHRTKCASELAKQRRELDLESKTLDASIEKLYAADWDSTPCSTQRTLATD
eukprot:1802459-Amphidinium_carterae.1